MNRLISLGSLGVLALTVSVARAETQAEIAARLNEEGKQLMYKDQPAEAAKKFQEAVARVPEAKYFVNLCTARLQEGKLDEALTACDAVDLNNPTPEQKTKASKLVEKINEEAKKQNLELHAGGGGGGDPGTTPPPDPTRPPDPRGDNRPPPPPRYQPAVGRPIGQNLVMASTPDNKYTWTLGAELFFGGGQIGQPDYYGSVVSGLRIKADVLVNPAARLGVQGYFQVSHLGAGSMDSIFVDTLDIFDVGIAGYKHLCLGGTPRLCVTPLVGVHLSLMSPAGEMDGTGSQVFNYAGLGGRAEIALTYAFGRRFEHALSVMAGVNLYTPVLSGPSANDDSGSLTIEEAGLDKGGAAGYVGLGYTYRFNTPLGSSPFVTLE
ncbi:MAG TPA: hypothetical protein VLM79_23535 [Kofleriaceae bacterium]|nr:hypothetical protein [Kofleriaceae bacterium]